MYQYKRVTVKAIEKAFENVFEGHMEIIEQQANDGWRFTAAIPTISKGHGRLFSFDLVFEKERTK